MVRLDIRGDTFTHLVGYITRMPVDVKKKVERYFNSINPCHSFLVESVPASRRGLGKVERSESQASLDSAPGISSGIGRFCTA
jgi:hypothetical protein